MVNIGSETGRVVLETVIKLFNMTEFDLPWDGWKSVKCPFHADNSNSASIRLATEEDGKFRGNGYIKCHASCKGRTLIQMMEDLKSEDMSAWEGWIEESNKKAEEKKEIPFKPLSRSEEVEQYASFLHQKGFTPDEIQEYGGELITNKEDTRYGYLVFKYGKQNKQSVARKVFEMESKERFINSKSNKGLFGLDQIPKTEKQIILVEGLTDLLAGKKHKLGNVVCSLGAQLSKEQAYLLRKRTVFIIYDPDFAGYEGAKSAAKLLRDYKATAIILEIPESFSEKAGTEKADVCYLLANDRKRFIDWLTDRISSYSTYDQDKLREKFRSGSGLRYWKTGIKSFDSLLGGGLAKGIHIFGGMPKIGKSTFCIELACKFREQNARVLYCSYELSWEQLWARIASRYSDFSWQDIEKNPEILGEKEWKILDILGEKLKIVSNFSLPEIQASLDSFDIFIIDYLQRMRNKQPGEMEKIKENLEGLAEVYQEHNKTIVLISEMSREMYNNQSSIGIVKGSGEGEYVGQSITRMNKVADHFIQLEVKGNTRGTEGRVLLDVNYPHQLIVETTMEEVYSQEVKR